MKTKMLNCSIIAVLLVASCGTARIQPSSQVKQMSDELAVTPYYDEQDRDYILEFAVNATDSSYVKDAWEDNQKLRAKLSKQNMRARKKDERGAAAEKVLLRVGNVGRAIYDYEQNAIEDDRYRHLFDKYPKRVKPE